MRISTIADQWAVVNPSPNVWSIIELCWYEFLSRCDSFLVVDLSRLWTWPDVFADFRITWTFLFLWILLKDRVRLRMHVRVINLARDAIFLQDCIIRLFRNKHQIGVEVGIHAIQTKLGWYKRLQRSQWCEISLRLSLHLSLLLPDG